MPYFGPSLLQIKLNKPPKMTNSTSIDVAYEGAVGNRMVANQDHCYSTALADKQINKKNLTVSNPLPKKWPRAKKQNCTSNNLIYRMIRK